MNRGPRSSGRISNQGDENKIPADLCNKVRDMANDKDVDSKPTDTSLKLQRRSLRTLKPLGEVVENKKSPKIDVNKTVAKRVRRPAPNVEAVSDKPAVNNIKLPKLQVNEVVENEKSPKMKVNKTVAKRVRRRAPNIEAASDKPVPAVNNVKLPKLQVSEVVKNEKSPKMKVNKTVAKRVRRPAPNVKPASDKPVVNNIKLSKLQVNEGVGNEKSPKMKVNKTVAKRVRRPAPNVEAASDKPSVNNIEQPKLQVNKHVSKREHKHKGALIRARNNRLLVESLEKLLVDYESKRKKKEYSINRELRQAAYMLDRERMILSGRLRCRNLINHKLTAEDCLPDVTMESEHDGSSWDASSTSSDGTSSDRTKVDSEAEESDNDENMIMEKIAASAKRLGDRVYTRKTLRSLRSRRSRKTSVNNKRVAATRRVSATSGKLTKRGSPQYLKNDQIAVCLNSSDDDISCNVSVTSSMDVSAPNLNISPYNRLRLRAKKLNVSTLNPEDPAKKKRKLNKPDATDIVFRNTLKIESHEIISLVHKLSKKLLKQNEDLVDYYQRNVVVECDEAAKLCVETVEQTGDVWKDARKLRITGSRCYGYYTHSQQKCQDWSYKLGSIVKPRYFNNFAMQHGTNNEAPARIAYAKSRNVDVVQMGLIVNPLTPWLGYSPDGMVVENGVPVKLIEIKCPVKGLERTAKKVYENTGYYCKVKEGLRKRHSYYGQMQMGMALTGLKSCDFVIYAPFDDSVCVEEIAFDVEFASEMIKAVTNVYFDIMLPFLNDNFGDEDDVSIDE